MYYLIYIGCLSIITFLIYGIDKKRAINNKWRIKEKTLLLFSVIGGFIGGILAMYVLRHKNRKWYFVFWNFFGLVLHIAISYYIFIM